MAKPEPDHRATDGIPPFPLDPETVGVPADPSLDEGRGLTGPYFPFLAPPQQPDEIGRLGPFRVLGELGRGGMGVVFRAEDPRLARQVALKVMLPELAGNAKAKARFLREARSAAAVEHERIVPLLQIDEAGGVLFLAMPLLKGMTLAAALKANRVLPVAEALRIGREVAEGLAAAHEKGLIHRDIKPANIWLEGDARRTRILDFGLAHGADAPAEAEPLTVSGQILGTPAYMSPERAWGEPTDARTDLFSLGVVMYQMTTGRLPFRGPTAQATLGLIATAEPTPPAELTPGLPLALNALILRLLSKSPADRSASAAAVAEELGRIEAGLTVEKSRGKYRTAVWLAVGFLILGGVLVAANTLRDPATDATAGPDGLAAEPKPPPDALSTERDEDAARWVLSVDGSVVVKRADVPILVTGTDELPPAPYRLTLARLWNIVAARDDDIKLLAGLPELDTVYLTSTSVTDAGLVHLAACPKLARLYVAFRPISDDGLEPLARLPLRVLHLAFTKVTERAVPLLATFDRLEELTLNRCGFSDTGLPGLAQMKNLRFVQLDSTQVSHAGAQRLSASLPRCWVSWDGGLIHPTDEPERRVAEWLLRRGGVMLTLWLADGKGLEVKSVAALPHRPFKVVGIDAAPQAEFDDAELNRVTAAAELESLRVTSSATGGVTDGGLQLLERWKATLRRLDLGGTDLTDAALDHVKGLPELRELNLKGTQVTEPAVKKLAAALPRCRIKYDAGVIEPMEK